MKILYGITRTELGGAQLHLLTLLQTAQSRGEVELMYGVDDIKSGTDDLIAIAKNMGIPMHPVPSLVAPLSPRRDLQAIKEMTQIIRKVNPDLVHLHSSKAGLLGRLASRLVGKPVIFTAHGWAFTEGVSWSRKLLAVAMERLAAPLSSRIISVSEYDAALARKWKVGRPHQVLAIHNGVSSDAPLQSSADTEGRKVRVLMAARFAAQKAQDALIRAVAEVPEVEAWLVGDGPNLVAMQHLVVQQGLQDRVLFLGRRSDVPELMAQADIFALISNYEGFPISTLEAMRAGLPTIVSDVGGAGEAVLHGITGYVVGREDHPGLVKVLRQLATDPVRRKLMGEASRARFLSRYTSDVMVQEVWKVYHSVLLENQSRRKSSKVSQ